MSIYLSSNPGSYTPEAANIERQIEGALRPLLIKTVEDYHMSVEDFFMLVSRAADMNIMSYNRQQIKTANSMESTLSGTARSKGPMFSWKKFNIFSLTIVEDVGASYTSLGVICCVDESNELYVYVVYHNPEHKAITESYVQELVKNYRQTHPFAIRGELASGTASEAIVFLINKANYYTGFYQGELEVIAHYDRLRELLREDVDQ